MKETETKIRTDIKVDGWRRKKCNNQEPSYHLTENKQRSCFCLVLNNQKKKKKKTEGFSETIIFGGN